MNGGDTDSICVQKRSLNDFVACVLPSLGGLFVLLFSIALAGMGQRYLFTTNAVIVPAYWGFGLALFFFILGFRWPLLPEERNADQSSKKWIVILSGVLWVALVAIAGYYCRRWGFRWETRGLIVYLAPAAFFSVGLRRFSVFSSLTDFVGSLLLTVLGTTAVWMLFHSPTMGAVYFWTGATLLIYILLLLSDRGRLSNESLRGLPKALKKRPAAIVLLLLLVALVCVDLWFLDSKWPFFWSACALNPILLWFARRVTEPFGKVVSELSEKSEDPGKASGLSFAFIILAHLAVGGAALLAYRLRVEWPFFVLNIGGLLVWYVGLFLAPPRKMKPFLWSGFLLSALYQTGAISLWGQDAFPNQALVPFLLSWLPALSSTLWLDRLRKESLPGKVTPEWVAWEIILLILIIGLACFFRFWKVEEIPYGIWSDEARECRDALSWSEGRPYSPFSYYASPGTLSFNFYILGIWYKIFGFGLGSARALVALTGVLTVLFLYFLGRMILGRSPSLIVAAFLSTSGWHVNFTRFFMEPPLSVMFIVLVFYYLVKGLRSRRFTDFLLSGAFVGFSTMTYAPSRLIPVVLVLLFLHQVLSRKGFLKYLWYAPVLMVLGGQLTSCPVNVAFFTDPGMFARRMNQTSVFGRNKTEAQAWQDVHTNLEKHLLMFNRTGDPNPRHGIPGSPKLNPVAAILFAVGVLVCIFRWRYFNSGMLILWLFIGMLAGVLTLEWEAPQSCRTQLIIPAAFLILGVPFAVLNRQMKGIFGRWSWIAVVLLALPGLIWSTRYDYNYYFEEMQHNSLVYEHFLGRDTTIARYLRDLEDRDGYYFVHQQPESDYPAIPFVLRNKPIRGVVYHSPDHIPLRNLTGMNLHYLLEPWRAPFPAEYFEHYYPDGEYNEYKSPYKETIFYTFTASKEEANSLQGLHGEFTEVKRPDKTVSKDQKDRFGATLNMVSSYPVDATWTGSLYSESTRDYDFAWSDGEPIRIAFHDEPLPEAAVDVEPTLLERGWHNVEIARRLEGDEKEFFLGFKNADGNVVPIMGNNLCVKDVPNMGYYARYYGNKKWEGPASFVMVQPILAVRWHPEPITGHLQWSAKWSAYLDIEQAGEYGFSVICNAYCRVLLDGAEILLQENKELAPGRKNIRLQRGEHVLEVYYLETYQYSEMHMKWAPPGGREEVIPFQRLRPKFD